MKSGEIILKALCVIIRDNKEILVGMGYDEVKQETFGRIIGGTMEFSETSEEGVRREIREELNCEIENLELLEVVENIFTYNGERGHQVIFLYKGDLSNKALYAQDKIPITDTINFEASWLPLEDVKSGKIKLYPEFDINII